MRIARFAQDSDTLSAQSLVTRVSIIFNIIVISTVHHLIGSSSFDHARNSAACLLDQGLNKKEITNKFLLKKIFVNFLRRRVEMNVIFFVLKFILSRLNKNLFQLLYMHIYKLSNCIKGI